MGMKPWEPIETLTFAALDTDCELMQEESETLQGYVFTLIGHRLHELEGWRSFIDIQTGEGREADEELAKLIVKALRDSAGITSGDALNYI